VPPDAVWLLAGAGLLGTLLVAGGLHLGFRRLVAATEHEPEARLELAGESPHAALLVPVIEDLLDRVEALELEVDRLSGADESGGAGPEPDALSR
jgi:threonine dehydrogenase-like Zn-dependent dehydrogenase